MVHNLIPRIRIFFVFSLLMAQAYAGEIVSFYPTGAVKDVKQATATFSTDMVAMGDPRSKKDPIHMTCEKWVEGRSENLSTSSPDYPKYTTRWADTKVWVIDFKEKVPGEIRCSFELKSDFKDIAGQTIDPHEAFIFSTLGKKILDIAPKYSNIDPDQYIVVQLDSWVDIKSVETKFYFEVEGMPDKVEAKLIQGKEREEVLKTAISNNWQWDEIKALLKEEKDISKIKPLEHFVVVSATRRFPESALVVLHLAEKDAPIPIYKDQNNDSYKFTVRSKFEATFSCERTAADRACNPILPMRIDFSSGVPYDRLLGSKMISDSGEIWIPEELKKKTSENLESLTFPAPFPASKNMQLILPPKLQDELGRELHNQLKFPLKISTDEYSPLVKFPAGFGILELKADPILPLSVRNVEEKIAVNQQTIEGKTLELNRKDGAAEIIKWYKAIQNKDEWGDERNNPILKDSKSNKFEISNELGGKSFSLLGIPLKNPGFYVVEVASPMLGKALTESKKPMFVATTALVTDMAVHFKKGRESSLVWVTHLSDASPVVGATISLVNETGTEIGSGVTDNQGILKLKSASLPCLPDISRNYDDCEVFVFAFKDNDFSFTSSAWTKGIESYRFNIYPEYINTSWGPTTMHSVLDRMASQPGDTIHMKHIIRKPHSLGFSMADPEKLPKEVFVVHEASGKTYTLPFKYDGKSGSAEGEFKIPKDATLGAYGVYLSQGNKNNQQTESEGEEGEESTPSLYGAVQTASFTVAQYRLPLMGASVKVQETPLISPDEVTLDLSAHYLSGGPAKNLKIKLRSSLGSGNFTPDLIGANDYTFFSEPLKAGIIKSYEDQSAQNLLRVQDLALDNNGGLKATIKDLTKFNKVQELVVEMEYTDPNGEIQTSITREPILPSDTIVGLKSESWYSESGKTKVEGVITNSKGEILENYPYVINAFQSQYITHRKRLVGGFYSYDHRTEVKALGKVCEGKSNKLGRFSCQPKLQAGSITLEASVSDKNDKKTFASVGVNVYASGTDSWWVPSDSDRIDILPEKKQYNPGENATLILNSPYAHATVLVTVEREGVLESFVKEVKSDKPIIDVPIKSNYAPNVFVSALVLRGRVKDPRPNALIDLARPAIKMGMVEVKVGHSKHELSVDLESDKKIYRPREKANIKVTVKTKNNEKLPANAEVAIAVVDEALMRLKENSSWKILQAMMGKRELAVSTSSGQNQVVGRRHFGSKAKAPGGGGGMMGGDSRELFEPVILWIPKLKLNDKGEASFSFSLNDSLSNFRVVAVATAGENFFGDGAIKIESTKDLIIYSGFAPMTREGDKIQNNFTLRNTTQESMNIELKISSKQISTLPEFPNIELGPSESKVLTLPIVVPDNINDLQFEISGKDKKSGSTDLLKVKVSVLPATPARILQATLFQLENKHVVPVKQPMDGLPGKGGIAIHASASLVSGLAGVKSYMNDYSYSCLEQKVSKAIVLDDKKGMGSIIENLPTYYDAEGLLKFFPTSRCGSAQLTRYVLNILNDNKFTLPNKTKKSITDGLTSYIEGKYECHNWWESFQTGNPYETEEKLLVLDSLSRYQRFSEKYLSSIKIDAAHWKTETVVAWYNLLKRESKIPNRDEHLKTVQNILRTRVNYQGSAINLQGGLDWEAQWRLFTSQDQEAMGVFGVFIDEPTWGQDVGKAARGITARLKKGHWDSTMSNAWGITQMKRFSDKFEKEKLDGKTKIDAAEISDVIDWKPEVRVNHKLLPWPKDSMKKEVAMNFAHQGSGKPWMHVETLSAIPLKAPLEMGYKITRKISPVLQAKDGKWSVGDVANIEVMITAKADQPWVVVRDPIPAGASHLGNGLQGTSQILDRAPLTKGASMQEWPAEYDEKSWQHFISYAGYLPAGSYKLNYRVRLNSAGTFLMPPSRVEAMYSPETFGENPNEAWTVSP